MMGSEEGRFILLSHYTGAWNNLNRSGHSIASASAQKRHGIPSATTLFVSRIVLLAYLNWFVQSYAVNIIWRSIAP